ncbi:MAG: sensor histidine kinase [Niabella sp.]
MSRDDLTISVVAGSAFFLMLTVFCVLFVLYYLKRRAQEKEERALLNLRFQQQLLQSKIEIQEQAFNNISRELHDNVGQQLSLAKLNLGTLKEIHNIPDKEKIESARELVSNSIYQIRSISKTLLGEKVSSIGIAEAIKNEVERISKLGLLTINLSFSRDHFSLDDQKEIILFRIVQEALNNIIKHAAASIVNISLDDEADHLKILIEDNGKGFKLAGESTSGIGLMNMKNRAHTIGADLFIESTPGQGTSIKILLKKPANH